MWKRGEKKEIRVEWLENISILYGNQRRARKKRNFRSWGCEKEKVVEIRNQYFSGTRILNDLSHNEPHRESKKID